MSKFNTGSDLDIEKTQNGFAVVNARIGIAGPDDRWAVEFWAQNLFNKNYHQVGVRLAAAGHAEPTRGVAGGLLSRSRPSSTAPSSASRGPSA